jgi:uridine kinase
MTAENIEKRLLGKVEMTKSLHSGVEFLNPGDTFFLFDKHWNIANEIVVWMVKEEFVSKGKKVVVAVSGPSGSGKSQVGYCIAAYLASKGLNTVCYSTDNCYLVEPNERAKLRKEAYENDKLEIIIGHNEYNWSLIESIEKAVKEGGSARTPVVDITKESRPVYDKLIDYTDYDVLLLDGLYAIAGNADVKVLLQETWDGVLRAQKGRSKEKLDDLRLRVIKLEMEEISRLVEKGSGKLITVTPEGLVSFFKKP